MATHRRVPPHRRPQGWRWRQTLFLSAVLITKMQSDFDSHRGINKRAVLSRCATLGFAFSCCGILGVCLGLGSIALRLHLLDGLALWTMVIIVGLSFWSVPGLLLSVAGMYSDRRRLASWGILLGLFGALFLADAQFVLRMMLRP